MARPLHKLSARKVATLTTPGRHSDGGGLYLVVDKNAARRWVFLFRWRAPGTPGPGRLREMGLGSTNAVSLLVAREEAARARAQVAQRIDPIAARRQVRVIPTFGQIADDLILTRTQEGVADKSLARIKRSLEQYAKPLRPTSIDLVDTDAIVAILKPIWLHKAATAEKVKSHIAAVLDAAKARGLRSGDNPARWKGHLDQLLARRNGRSRNHHEALPYASCRLSSPR